MLEGDFIFFWDESAADACSFEGCFGPHLAFGVHNATHANELWWSDTSLVLHGAFRAENENPTRLLRVDLARWFARLSSRNDRFLAEKQLH